MANQNTLPCGQCAHYDGTSMQRAGKPTRMGWCAAYSVYPAVDPPDRPAPRGVRRVAEGELSRPVIKALVQVETGCSKAKPRQEQNKPKTREQLLALAQGKR